MLNPLAWTNVPNGQFAANQSSIRSFRGIRKPQENANFSRNFRIKEGVALNIRVEFTNIFNRLQLGAIGLGNFAAAPTTFATGANKGLLSSGFGVITSPLTGSVTGQRAGSLVARFTFWSDFATLFAPRGARNPSPRPIENAAQTCCRVQRCIQFHPIPTRTGH